MLHNVNIRSASVNFHIHVDSAFKTFQTVHVKFELVTLQVENVGSVIIPLPIVDITSLW